MQKYHFKCNNCDHRSENKFGFCPKCENGMGEKINSPIPQNLSNKHLNSSIGIKSVSDYDNEDFTYYDTGIKEINDCLGGGLAINSLTLFSGPPGAGKSTLLLQLINNLAAKNSCAYITAEETGQQVNKRYHRLGLKNNFKLHHLSDINEIIQSTRNCNIIFIDSINTVYNQDFNKGVIGSVSQIKSNIFSLLEYVKNENKTIIVIGQITKDGEIAGPKMLEHMVDISLYFDYFGDGSNYRILKNIKNRFGDNNNIAILEMKEKGLNYIKDYSNIFLNKNNVTEGTAFSVFAEGSKPIFVEIQSLIVPTKSEKNLVQIVGYDLKRLYQLSAILFKYSKINMYGKNVFVNIANGLKINEPVIDLGVYMSIISSEKNKIFQDMLFIGEIGLNGNIIKHQNEEFIVKECQKYFKHVVSYTTGYKNIKDLDKLF